MPRVLAIDIGGTRMRAAAFEGELLAYEVLATEVEKGPDHVIKRLLEASHRVLKKVSWEKIDGIGMAVPGPLDRVKKTINSPPNMPGWDNIPIGDIFESEFNAPSFIDNDANAAALGEAIYGAGKGASVVTYFTVSTGIGGGCVIKGHIFHGAGDNAAEFGHQKLDPFGPPCGCGRRGCLEALASGTAIARRAKELLLHNPQSLLWQIVQGNIDKVSARLVAEAASKGDALSLRVIQEAGFWLGLGIANIINLFNPKVVILGGGVMNAGELILKPARETALQKAIPQLASIVEIKVAGLGEFPGLYGAGEVALQGLRGELDTL
ncbi:ROK family protein [bacterium]|nr:ROK family protein [bacterium]